MFEHLLPRARAWQIKLASPLRDFFLALTDTPSDARDFVDAVRNDIDPQTTRELALWEDQFGLSDTGLTDQQRRDRLDATWAATGGQSPRYLQDLFQAHGFDVYVHEWWEVPAAAPPVPRNPNDHISSSGILYVPELGEPLAECGEATALLGNSVNARGYPLVNKIETTTTQFLGAGDPAMQLGESEALLGNHTSVSFGEVTYLVPVDVTLYPFFLYIGGQTFPDQANVDGQRRDEFEELLLRYCPGHLWLGVLVDYV
jgi:hypothetical protein